MSSPSSVSRSGICQFMISLALFAAAMLFVVAAVDPASAQTFITIHKFTSSPDGSSPFGGLVADSQGNYYGTTQFGGTSNNGTVFELSPPAVGGGHWTESVIWSFAGHSDGASPSYQLLIDAKGNLYGETQYGGNACSCGTVFALLPPKTTGGPWTKLVLYASSGSGGYISDALTVDRSGTMYGTQYLGGTYSSGQAFKVAPATGGGFTGTVLYNFGVTGTDSKEPYGPLTLDSNGNLYGVSNIGGTNDLGTVFRLTPPAGGGGNWTNAVLYSFPGAGAGCNPGGNIILDQSGRLYGQATSCGGNADRGVIFRLSPPTGSGPWTESVLHTFSSADGGGPYPSLILDAKTNVFYGTSFWGGGYGVVFQLKPPAGGAGTWIERVIHTSTGLSDGDGPLGPMVWDANGVLYGTAYYGAAVGHGTAFSIVP